MRAITLQVNERVSVNANTRNRRENLWLLTDWLTVAENFGPGPFIYNLCINGQANESEFHVWQSVCFQSYTFADVVFVGSVFMHSQSTSRHIHVRDSLYLFLSLCLSFTHSLFLRLCVSLESWCNLTNVGIAVIVCSYIHL